LVVDFMTGLDFSGSRISGYDLAFPLRTSGVHPQAARDASAHNLDCARSLQADRMGFIQESARDPLLQEGWMPAIRAFPFAAAFALSAGTALAQAPLPSFPLYCQGPLTTGTHAAPPPPPSSPTSTVFTWADQGAGVHAPGPGVCAWADRGVRPEEIVASVHPHGNAICDNTGLVNGVPVGRYLEVGVYRDPAKNNCMHVTHVIGFVTPPFSAQPALPPFTRQSIKSLTSAQIAALRKGVQVMMSRAVTDPTSYRFQANIHGAEDNPSTSLESKAWNRCQHGSYYFFSWHRMYLYFFERLLRAASGDGSLALPYWNWSDATQRTLPVPFRSPANSSNPLYISDRGAGMNNGTAQLPATDVDFGPAFAYTNFDSPTGSGLSFGGQIASPTQFNAPHGELESQPHDVVHVDIGGLMSDPDTAAQDPIFWLHHANIDRLWKRWLGEDAGRQDPTDSAWLNTTFTFYDENGTPVTLTGRQVVDTVGSMDYRYDDDPTVGGAAPGAPAAPQAARQATTVAVQMKELATTQLSTAGKGVALSNAPVTITVPLSNDATTQMKAMASASAPQRLVLRLGDIQYEARQNHHYEVYLDLPAGQTPTPSSPYYVGTLAFFGLKPHPMAGHPMPANATIFRDYDVTGVLRALSGRGALDQKQVTVTLVPRGLVNTEQQPLAIAPTVAGTIGSVTLAVE
jgi:Common central domain of tyrosinase/Polyphenol oxidase middle domain